MNRFLLKFNVDIDYLFNTSETELSDFKLVQGLPSCYREVLVCFNACKKNMEYSQISSDSFLEQTIWCNKYVRYKGKTLFFHNWIKSGIKYVCDLFDGNGRLKSIECFTHILYRRHNIFCENLMLKSVFTKLGKHFNFSNATHVNP